VSSRRGPRPLAAALSDLRSETVPATLLAAVQELWPRLAGETIAALAEPVAERDGVVTIACRSATWAQELDLLQAELRGRLNAALEAGDTRFGESPVARLRVTADLSRFYA
jgi:predicted nucleic acid-binding Zn ribbon protein